MDQEQESGGIVPARYWSRLEDGRLRCDLCPHSCTLREGQRGLCFVRACQGNRLVLTTYGRSSGFCIDPIEKKPFHHFLPGTAVLSFGTAGCNLSCQYCQNWDISKSQDIQKLSAKASPETIARAARELDCASVALTYNDPTIFLEYAVDVAAACREAGIATVAVTAGYINEEPREEFYRAMDAANVDLKAFTDKFYREITGGRLQPVLDTLVYIKRHTGVWLEITNLLIPGHNDSPAEISSMTEWVVENLGPDVPIHFSAFHPDWKMLDVPSTATGTLQLARRIALSNGVRHAYVGNVRDERGESTFCCFCSTLLIGRDGYEITDWNLEKGRCPSCGTLCPGIFQSLPGRWGARRMPVQLSQFAA